MRDLPFAPELRRMTPEERLQQARPGAGGRAVIAWNAPEPESREPARVGPIDLMVLILFPWIEPPVEITYWDCSHGARRARRPDSDRP